MLGLDTGRADGPQAGGGRTPTPERVRSATVRELIVVDGGSRVGSY